MKYYYLKFKNNLNFSLFFKSLFVCFFASFIFSSNLSFYKNTEEKLRTYDISFEDFIKKEPSIVDLKRDDVLKAYTKISRGPNPIMELYKNSYTNEYIVNYFSHLTGSKQISLSVLYHSYKYNIHPELSFALAWNESGFVKSAINHNTNLTIDRGLFQLNSKTFRNLANTDFFDPDVNALHGLKFLAWCFSKGKTQYNALVIYNAGISRLHNVPRSTLYYISKISKKERIIRANALYYVRKSIKKDKALI